MPWFWWLWFCLWWKFFQRFSSPLGIILRALLTIFITFTFMCHGFLFSDKVFVFVYLFVIFNFHSVVHENSKIHEVTIAWIQWSVCISKSQRISCVSFHWTDSGLCVCHSVVWSLSLLKCWFYFRFFSFAGSLPLTLIIYMQCTGCPKNRCNPLIR